MIKRIKINLPYSRQYVDSKDISSVIKVLKSDFITQGKTISYFEDKITKKVGSKYGVATNSATSALHIACLALNLSKNDILWTVPNTFVASANCGLYCGAKVDFVDIDEKTLNISVEKFKKKLIKAKSKKKLPKIIVPVHFAGNPYPQKELYELSKKFKFKIIEDASHALGSIYKNNFVGSCKWSDICVFSFHPVKPITTAEGGMALTNDENIYKKLSILRNHGINKNPVLKNKKKLENWYYEQQTLGFNYRMNDIEAALGISQIKKLDLFINYRNKIAKKNIEKFKFLPIKTQLISSKAKSSYHLFVILFPNSNKFIKNYNKIFKFFLKNGIGVNLHYLPVHLHPVYKKLGFKKGDFPNSENYAKRAFSIPIFHKISIQNQNHIINVVKKICIKFKDKKNQVGFLNEK